MTHDAEIYHDPMNFDPERFLGKKVEPDPGNLVFGFGRRCVNFHTIKRV